MALDLTLAACHMVGDYVTQTDYMAKNKLTDWRVRLLHVTVYTAGFIVVPLLAHMTIARAGLFLAAVFVPHFIADCRRWASGAGWPPKPILVDQSIHAACLAAAAVAFGL